MLPQSFERLLASLYSVAFKRGKLRSLYRKAVDDGITLSAALNAELDLQTDAVSGVTLLASASANGKSTSNFLPPGVTIEDAVVLAESLVSLYEEVDAALISSGIATPTDAQRVAEMLYRLQSADCASVSFALIREDPESEEVPIV